MRSAKMIFIHEECFMPVKNFNPILVSVSLILLMLACSLPGGQATQAVVPETSSPPTEIGIQHQIVPVNLPADRSSHAGDYDSSTTAAKRSAAGGDRFTFARFERPFN